MKKNISINISGIIFHIEEDGYEKLKQYLESINRYFSSFDDSLEIIADIESRIAEIFLSKLKDGKQVVTIDDVEILMATMGSIKDFQAAEEDSAYITSMGSTEKSSTANLGEKEDTEPMFAKKLYRDKRRKLLGGVLAGIAYYFNMDPLWIRLIYILLFFGVSILPSIAGILLIGYIVLWIAIPESDDLVEERKIKKMYRNPDDKVLGGVAGGIAAYFGVDVVIVRLLFVVSIFLAFSGVILYIIMWIILPEAKTLTDKMEMQGQPVTLSNIESNIKKSLNIEDKEETNLVKILLFPFRLIAALIQFLSKALGPFLAFLAEAVRIVLGVLLIILGISVILGIIGAAGVLIGLIASGDFIMIDKVPFEIVTRDIQLIPGIAMTIGAIIPFIFLTFLGFAIIIKKAVIKARIGWLLLAIWLISIVVLLFTIPPFIKNFQRNGKHLIENQYMLGGKTMVLKLNEKQNELRLDEVTLDLKSHDGDYVKIEELYRSMGASREAAIENAKMVIYGITATDSVFTFDRDLTFRENARYRNQKLDVTIWMPLHQPFIIEQEMRSLIGNYLYRNGFTNQDMKGNTWEFGEDGLKCLTCPISPEASDAEEDSEIEPTGDAKWDIEGYQRSFELADFTEIEANSPFRMMIREGPRFEVILNGEKEHINDVVVDKTGDILNIDFKSGIIDWKKNQEKVNVYIMLPDLNRVELGGACRAFISGFDSETMEVFLNGAAMADMDIRASFLEVDLKGASRLVLRGVGEMMKCELSGAASLDAFDFITENAEIDARTASNGLVTVSNNLEVRTSGSSSVRYQGDPNIDVNKSGASSVEKK